VNPEAEPPVQSSDRPGGIGGAALVTDSALSRVDGRA
jgi:hypothetical protein